MKYAKLLSEISLAARETLQNPLYFYIKPADFAAIEPAIKLVLTGTPNLGYYNNQNGKLAVWNPRVLKPVKTVNAESYQVRSTDRGLTIPRKLWVEALQRFRSLNPNLDSYFWFVRNVQDNMFILTLKKPTTITNYVDSTVIKNDRLIIRRNVLANVFNRDTEDMDNVNFSIQFNDKNRTSFLVIANFDE